MAAHALSESGNAAPRLAVGRVNDMAYASLLGGGPRVLKKKPVLVLDPDELAKAHLAIAMGGAQIMEAADDPVAVARPRTPAIMLGLAPVGAPDDWDPGFAALVEPEEDSHEEGLEAGDEAEDEATADPALWEGLGDEDEPEEGDELDEGIVDPLAYLQELIRQGDSFRDEDAAMDGTEPGFGLFDPPAEAEPEPEPEPVLEWEVAAEAEPEPYPEDDVFDLPLAAAFAPEPEPEPDPAEDEWADEGPDLSWMLPKERRELIFSESAQSALRARLVNLEAEPDEDFVNPSLLGRMMDRLRDWWARVFG